MSRIRLRTGPVAMFGAAFVIALIVFLPMRLVLGWFGLGEVGLTARQASGSIWLGSLREVHFGDLDLGDLKASLSPIQLLVGRARIDLAGRNQGTDAKPLNGALSVSRHSFGMDDMTASLPAGSVFAPVPVTGIDLDDVSVHFVDGNCESAEGRVRAKLSGDFAGIALPQGMDGTARCDTGALLVPLASQSGTESVMLRLWSNGRFRAELSLQPPGDDPAVAQKLTLSGFQPSGKGYTLSIEGTF